MRECIKKRRNHKFIVFFPVFACLGLLFTARPAVSHADAQIPYSVRVGLYFDSGANAETRSMSSYRVYSANGVSLGCADNGGNYRHIYDFSFPDASVKMELSTHFFEKGYAVLTGREADTYFDVFGRARELQQRGYDPALVYFNGWALIVGYYDTHSAALQAVESEFKAAFPDYGYTAEALSGKYTMIAMNNIRQFIFDAGEKNLRISPGHPDGGDSPALVELNGKPYRGAIELVRGAKSEITAVNIIALEDYLYGVVPMELQASSPAEALKAQAVASRTYAVNMIGKHGAEGFDMCRTDSCQVYGGYEAEDARATRAVDDTRGKVVLYKGSIAEVYFFSSSGGYTANVSHVWNSVREYPYLTAVEDNYESGDSKNYEWETVYTAAELKTKLASNGVNIGNITGVAVTKAAEGGRVIELTITGADGVKVFTNGSCRTFLGNLHSQVYTVYANDANNQTGAGGRTYASAGADGTIGNTISGGCAAIGAGGVTAVIKGNGGTAVSAGGYTGLPACGAVFRFAGRGWGHGVGMSQEGAKGMAYAGFSYIDILIHYFPGCTIG